MSDSADSIPDANEHTELPGSDFVRLDHFLKLCGAAETGGQAKMMIQCGDVQLNGEVETRRRKKLVAGDVVSIAGDEFVIEGVD